jgi:hypothetical protein
MVQGAAEIVEIVLHIFSRATRVYDIIDYTDMKWWAQYSFEYTHEDLRTQENAAILLRFAQSIAEKCPIELIHLGAAEFRVLGMTGSVIFTFYVE